MATKARKPPTGTVSDENAIIEELGAEPLNPDDPNGPMEVDEEKVREIGALDPESVMVNRRNQDVINRKKGGEKHISFSDPEILTKYEEVIKIWPLNTITILVKRLTGTQATFHIDTQPRTAAELYAALMNIHGRREDTTYDVILRDSYKKEQRGSGRITLPSTLDEPHPPMQGQIMNQQLPPGYVLAQPVPQQQQPQAPQPVVQVMPAAPAPQQPGTDPVAMLKQMMEMMKVMQPQQQQPQMPVAAPQVVAAPPPPQPPQDPNLAMIMQMMEMMKTMQGQQQVAPPPPPTPVVVQPAAPAQSPDVSAITTAMMAMMKQMFEMMRSMQPPPAAAPVSSPADEYRPPYRGPRPPAYGPRPYEGGPRSYEGGPAYGPRSYEGGGYGPQPQPPQPPVRQRTAAEEFREAATLINTAVDIANRFSPQQQQEQQQHPFMEEGDDSPVRVIDAGPAKLVLNKQDGSARIWETGWANSDRIFKGVSDILERLQKNAMANQQQQPPQQQQRQQLPPGYVEVGPGYQPPQGFVAVPVDQIPQQAQQAQYAQQSGLPPPPTNLPPTIDQAPPEPQRPAWGMPTIPGEEQ